MHTQLCSFCRASHSSLSFSVGGVADGRKEWAGGCCCDRTEWQGFFPLIHPGPTNGAALGNRELVPCTYNINSFCNLAHSASKTCHWTDLFTSEYCTCPKDICVISTVICTSCQLKIHPVLSEVQRFIKKENKIGTKLVLLIESVVVGCASAGPWD